MATGGAGLSFGIGGWESQLVALFQDEKVFKEFVINGFDAGAKAGTMVGDDKEELGYGYHEGRAVFLLTKKGWKVNAKLTGTRYWPDDSLN